MSDLIPMDHGQCFVMQPFDKGIYDKRYREVFKPAIKAAFLQPYRVDEDPSADVLIDKIEKQIRDSTVGFAEITTDNPNVWYELGYAMAKGKQICLVCSSAERKTAFPFDIRHRNIITYEATNPSDFKTLEDRITARLKAMLELQSKIETVTELTPTTNAQQGLTDHEIAALTLIMAQSLIGDVTGRALIEDMFKAGYTRVATGIAISKLMASAHIDYRPESDMNGNNYDIYFLKQKGRDWLIQNENRLQLKIQTQLKHGRPSPSNQPPPTDPPVEISDGDIPF